MNEKTGEREGVPADYPGRIVDFGGRASHMVIALLGVQSTAEAQHAAFMDTMRGLAREAHGPARLEAGRHGGKVGVPTTLAVAYWTDRQRADDWWRSGAVSRWWQGLACDGEAGWFCERMAIPEARFNYAAGTEDRHGSAATLPLAPCKIFGYWGAYRDRLPASAADPFESPLAEPPAPRDPVTRGRRLAVRIPDNLCYIREGQGWADCGAEERAVWNEQMKDKVDTWVGRLAADPVATGCLALRDIAEFDALTGAPLERRSQLAFLLSLGHIERAARTDPAHLAVHGAFAQMYREPRFTPRMHVWVEVGILKEDEFAAEYVNCHPGTGLLPFFTATPVSERG
ncbi:MAG: phenylacetaldoxime dehydratase family protein [Gammaproteobacteria bacterium]|nr:phenylacetaldoxime dehydratase family protein [Gammaproteobacteria bacterium]